VGSLAFEAHFNKGVGIIHRTVRIRYIPVAADKIIHIRFPGLVVRPFENFYLIPSLKFHGFSPFSGLGQAMGKGPSAAFTAAPLRRWQLLHKSRGSVVGEMPRVFF